MKAAQYAIITVAFFIFQSASFSFLPHSLLRPDLGLILVIHCSLAWGRSGGMLFGAATGLFRDLLLCGAVGQGPLSWGLAGFCAGALRESYISGEMGARIMLVVVFTAVDTLIQASMIRMALPVDVGQVALSAVGGQTLSNVIFSAMAMPLFSLLDGWVDARITDMEKARRRRSFLEGMRATER